MKLKKFTDKYGLSIVLIAFIALMLALMFFTEKSKTKEYKEQSTKNRVQLITLENGVECAVVKGKYSDNAISCN